MMRADYSKIASFYDKGRRLSEQNTVLWTALIADLSAAQPGARALDLGCGTGRFALPMAQRLGLAVTGADSSAEMLARAREKDSRSEVTWVLADANALTFAPGSFDLVFMSHLLHHVDTPATVLRECHKVLAPSGSVLIRYGAMEDIADDVEHALFPEVMEIDKPRTPTRALVEQWLVEGDFEEISSREVVQQTYETGSAHLEAASARSTSVLSMISEEAFQTGVRRLAEYVARLPADQWVLFDRMTLTVARKSKARPD